MLPLPPSTESPTSPQMAVQRETSCYQSLRTPNLSFPIIEPRVQPPGSGGKPPSPPGAPLRTRYALAAQLGDLDSVSTVAVDRISSITTDGGST